MLNDILKLPEDLDSSTSIRIFSGLKNPNIPNFPIFLFCFLFHFKMLFEVPKLDRIQVLYVEREWQYLKWVLLVYFQVGFDIFEQQFLISDLHPHFQVIMGELNRLALDVVPLGLFELLPLDPRFRDQIPFHGHLYVLLVHQRQILRQRRLAGPFHDFTDWVAGLPIVLGDLNMGNLDGLLNFFDLADALLLLLLAPVYTDVAILPLGDAPPEPHGEHLLDQHRVVAPVHEYRVMSFFAFLVGYSVAEVDQVQKVHVAPVLPSEQLVQVVGLVLGEPPAKQLVLPVVRVHYYPIILQQVLLGLPQPVLRRFTGLGLLGFLVGLLGRKHSALLGALGFPVSRSHELFGVVAAQFPGRLPQDLHSLRAVKTPRERELLAAHPTSPDCR